MDKGINIQKISFGLNEITEVRKSIDELLQFVSSQNRLDEIPYLSSLFSFCCRLNEIMHTYYKMPLTEKGLYIEILTTVDELEFY